MKTKELWLSFRENQSLMKDLTSETKRYTMEFYPNGTFTKPFDPNIFLEQWVCVESQNEKAIPQPFDSFIFTGGTYAIISYFGSIQQIGQVYGFMATQWLPQNGLAIDERPHFSSFDGTYNPMNEKNQETIGIPVIQLK